MTVTTLRSCARNLTGNHQAVLSLLVLMPWIGGEAWAAPRFHIEGHTNALVFFGVRPDAGDDILDATGRKVRAEMYSERFNPHWRRDEVHREFIVELNAIPVIHFEYTISPALKNVTGGYTVGTTADAYTLPNGLTRLLIDADLSRKVTTGILFDLFETTVSFDWVNVEVTYYAARAKDFWDHLQGPFVPGAKVRGTNGTILRMSEDPPASTPGAGSAQFSLGNLAPDAFAAPAVRVVAWDRYGITHVAESGAVQVIGERASCDSQFRGLSWSNVLGVGVIRPTRLVFRNVRVQYAARPPRRYPEWEDRAARALGQDPVAIGKTTGADQNEQSNPSTPPTLIDGGGHHQSVWSSGTAIWLADGMPPGFDLQRWESETVVLEHLRGDCAISAAEKLAQPRAFPFHSLSASARVRVVRATTLWTNAAGPALRLSGRMIAVRLGEKNWLPAVVPGLADEVHQLRKYGAAPAVKVSGLLPEVAGWLSADQLQEIGRRLDEVLPNPSGTILNAAFIGTVSNRAHPLPDILTAGNLISALGSNGSPAALEFLKPRIADDRIGIWWRAVEVLPLTARETLAESNPKVHQRIALVHDPDTPERWRALGQELRVGLTMELKRLDTGLFDWLLGGLITKCDRDTATAALVNHLAADPASPEFNPGAAWVMITQINDWHGTQFAPRWKAYAEFRDWIMRQKPAAEWREAVDPLLRWYRERPPEKR